MYQREKIRLLKMKHKQKQQSQKTYNKSVMTEYKTSVHLYHLSILNEVWLNHLPYLLFTSDYGSYFDIPI